MAYNDPPGGFHPGGHKGKLHRELGIAEGMKIPHARLEAAEHSSNPTIKRDAIRAETMEHWHHGGAKKKNRSPLGNIKHGRPYGD